ncbi:Bug family tripartite tricarboxylate transporter substrate binding protein [Bordetella tumulicola]|uniref:Bug family tripartite tricarboxylate transporter substrate binding protein n=1 Tax=Bordetella tumulicola TaxID=1649133 RepID=UPI0039EEA653
MIDCVKRRAMLGTLACASFFTALPAHAQSGFPEKTVTVVVPFAPGGSFDVIARQLAVGLGKVWKQPVVIDNRSGAGGNLGAQAVIKAKPDGYTLLFWGDGVLTNPLLYSDPPFDAIRDIAGVALVATTPQVLVSNSQSSIKTMSDVVKSTQPLNYGTAGNGTPGHLAAELMRREGANQLSHIPYRGGSPALTDLLGGQIQLVSTGLPATLPFIRSGRVHPIAVTSKERLEILPDVSTVGETIKGYEVDTWFGMMAPQGTPLEIRTKIASDIKQILASPQLKKQLAEGGFLVRTSTPTELEQKMVEDLAFWKEQVTKSGARAE